MQKEFYKTSIFVLDNCTFIEPYNYKLNILSYGDSITQGYDALFPSNSYINQLSLKLDTFEQMVNFINDECPKYDCIEVIKGVGDDLLNAKVPEDSVFIAAHSVDVHGRFGPKSNEYVPINGKYYGVPYRSLIPVNIDGLLVAGRCLSADSTAAGAVRVMPPCMAMGQSAGTAAALSIKDDITPRQLSAEKIRKELIKKGIELCQTN